MLNFNASQKKKKSHPTKATFRWQGYFLIVSLCLEAHCIRVLKEHKTNTESIYFKSTLLFFALCQKRVSQIIKKVLFKGTETIPVVGIEINVGEAKLFRKIIQNLIKSKKITVSPFKVILIFLQSLTNMIKNEHYKRESQRLARELFR